MELFLHFIVKHAVYKHLMLGTELKYEHVYIV